MGSLGSPKTWVPYTSSKDCSQGFCSLYCPQWCYIIFPPPPPLDFPEDNSPPNFSPLVIAIIGILASAFLLVSYYTIISKYCGNNTDRSTRRENHDLDRQEMEDDHSPSLHEPWHIETTGLDEALIKSIAACKYKKGDGLVDGTDCSVCLSEFKEDDTIRLLPKCSHAFHLPCIDTWLRSHSNCPLCRANIVAFAPSSPLPLPQLGEINPSNYNESSMDESRRANENVVVVVDTERGGGGGGGEEMDCLGDQVNVSKNPFRAFSDLGNSEERDIIIEIRDERYQSVRRSVSMDHPTQNRVLVADILCRNENEAEDVDEEEYGSSDGACSSKVPVAGEIGKAGRRRGVLHCVMSPVAMKRSFSSGRFFLTKPGRARHPIIPH
ncbi:hypothetical protein FEM48_Zijuj11G0088600 [Ziziphus jujuba var. spinosa]|uniref:RING-type E3 ubiquitin transferase n=1 Tax=Ziziphus jujuba var. spinosa TaxID=714518 RepID=A0A978UHZ7_ZIZJJ|nr:hypothetical protein FEM48_Zijuj11G0088600 [Ziziphus jujuba var. spinosa]